MTEVVSSQSETKIDGMVVTDILISQTSIKCKVFETKKLNQLQYEVAQQSVLDKAESFLSKLILTYLKRVEK